MADKALTFEALVQSIQDVHRSLAVQTAKAVNLSLTLRNWLIGFYISEYERGGADRATYGERLMDELAHRLSSAGLSSSEDNYTAI